ncbi:MAG TPA: chemotaxis protein CheA [Spirochaetia bacterium]|nr:MAG: hypothetical protein A2Y41_10350 [Spirochaetes bacterium GWB1_36_13]HCL57296.1 chemotaxis protein CheA [Spirochaetia bacterium]
MKILIVDDEIEALNQIAEALEPTNYQIMTRSNPFEAFEEAKKEKTDLIITDIKMPGMNGIELIEKVREIQPEIFVIYITAFGDLRDSLIASDAPPKRKADAFFKKPVEFSKIINALKEIEKKKSAAKVDDETKEIIEAFVSESWELIENAEPKILLLSENTDPELVNTVFRLFHSLKSTAGYLNFDNVKKITHVSENLLDIYRKEGHIPDQSEIDLLLKSVDLLKHFIRQVEKELHDQGNEENVNLLTQEFHALIQKLSEVKENKELEVIEEKPSEKQFDNLISNELENKFVQESIELLDLSEKDALALEKEPHRSELVSEIFRAVHTLKGNAGFFGNQTLEKHCMEMENILDSVRKDKIAITDKIISFILKSIDFLRNHLLNSQEEDMESENKFLGEILLEMGAVDENNLNKALLQQNKKLGEILLDMGSVKKETLETALKQQSVKEDDSMIASDIKKKDIRVDKNKLDRLFNLVGELITAEAMVINNPEIKEIKNALFKKAAGNLSKITREIQEVAMEIRMIPLDGLFNKMNRLVRDLSRKIDKKLNFRISGQDTEMDKTVIEEISDPLVHIIRNAIDHGLENKEERLKSQKSEAGLIFLSAKYEGNEIWISISDDGKGLDREKILKRALERGLIEKIDESLSDPEVWNFVFEPGFSTAEQVSEISGRGVGMDVVKKNIEKLKGKITIKSFAGKGSEFILKIPLTMAIIDAVTFKIKENYYSIPLPDIKEFYKVKENQVIQTDTSHEVIHLRGESIPVIRLSDYFKLSEGIQNLTEGVVIVVQNLNKKACLLIDKIIDSHQLVIKSLPEFMGEGKGISGCSILGSGEISFILDTKQIIQEWLS